MNATAPEALEAPLDIPKERLREAFWEYIGGQFSEIEFKKAVAEYSQTLRATRRQQNAYG